MAVKSKQIEAALAEQIGAHEDLLAAAQDLWIAARIGHASITRKQTLAAEITRHQERIRTLKALLAPLGTVTS